MHLLTYMYFLCMYACLSVFMCTTCMPDTLGGQKWVLAPLELELLMVVSCQMGAENGTWILYKTDRCS